MSFLNSTSIYTFKVSFLWKARYQLISLQFKLVRKLSTEDLYLYYTYFLLHSSGDARDGFPPPQLSSPL